MSKMIAQVTEVSEDDYSLVDALCHAPSAPKMGGNSRLYYLSTCRRGWEKYWDGEQFIPITPCPPNKGGTAFVRPIGMWKPETIAALAREYVAATREQVVVKNISGDQARQLSPYGFGPYREEDGWSGYYRYDEEEYPEVMVDLDQYCSSYAATRVHNQNQKPFPQTILDHKGIIASSVGEPFRKRFINSLRESAALNLSVEDLDVRAHREEMMNFIFSWSEDYIARKASKENTGDLDDLRLTYTSFVFEPYGGGWLFRREGKAVGFIRCAPGFDNVLDFYAAPYDPAPCLKKQALHFEMYNIALHLARAAQYTKANFGGSEEETLYYFKRRFAHRGSGGKNPEVRNPPGHAVMYSG